MGAVLIGPPNSTSVHHDVSNDTLFVAVAVAVAEMLPRLKLDEEVDEERQKPVNIMHPQLSQK